MKLRDIIFTQPQWNSKTLWSNIQAELGGQMIYIHKINKEKTRYRDNLIRELFYEKKKSVKQIADNFGICKMRVRQIINQDSFGC